MSHRNLIATTIEVLSSVDDYSAKQTLAKAVRRLTEVSLVEAGFTPQQRAAYSGGGVTLTREEHDSLLQYRKLDAVKLYKARRNVSLMDAKTAVERYMEACSIGSRPPY